MDSMIVDQDALHLEVGLLTGFLVFELNEGILKTIAGAFVANDFTGEDFAEAAEDQIQVVICNKVSRGRDDMYRHGWLTFCDWVQLAYEKHVFGGLDLCIG